MPEVTLINRQRPTAERITVARSGQIAGIPKSRMRRMFEDATEAPNSSDSKVPELQLIRPNLGEMTETPPATARRMCDNRPRPVVRASIAHQVKNIGLRKTVIDRVRPSEKHGDTSNHGGMPVHHAARGWVCCMAIGLRRSRMDICPKRSGKKLAGSMV